MVCDRIGNETNLAFLCDLFHNCSFADTRRSDKQQWTLAHSRNKITPKVMCPFSGRSVWEGQRSLPEILIVQIEFCGPCGNLLVQGFFMIKNKCSLISG